jgi:hypothetical protein
MGEAFSMQTLPSPSKNMLLENATTHAMKRECFPLYKSSLLEESASFFLGQMVDLVA